MRKGGAPLAILCALSLMLGACGLVGEATGPAAQPVLVTRAADAPRAAALISQYRSAHGLSAVSLDPILTRAEEQQARAVAASGRLSHGDFPSRMAAYGITGVSAENLSAGRSSVGEVISGWKASKGHNENLLLAGVRRIGIARVDTPGAGYGQYWALVLSQ